MQARCRAVHVCAGQVVTAVAFVCWYSSVSALGADRAGLLTGIAPISAALTGILTIGQVPAPLVWLGMLVVICGLAVGFRPNRPGDPR